MKPNLVETKPVLVRVHPKTGDPNVPKAKAAPKRAAKAAAKRAAGIDVD